MMHPVHQKRRLGVSLTRTISLFVNLAFIILGLLLVITGGVVSAQLDSLGSLLNVTLPAGLIVLGVFLMLFSVIGILGALRQRQLLIIIYLVLLSLLIICEFGVAIGAYSQRGNISTANLGNTWSRLSPKARTRLENYGHCCGWANSTNDPGSCSWINPGNNTNPNDTTSTTATSAASTAASTATTVASTTTTTASTATTAASTATTAASTTNTAGPTATSTVSSGSSSATSSAATSTDAREYPSIQPMIRFAPIPLLETRQITPSDVKGCSTVLSEKLQGGLYAIGTIGILFALLELGGLASELALLIMIRRHSPRLQHDL